MATLQDSQCSISTEIENGSHAAVLIMAIYSISYVHTFTLQANSML